MSEHVGQALRPGVGGVLTANIASEIKRLKARSVVRQYADRGYRSGSLRTGAASTTTASSSTSCTRPASARGTLLTKTLAAALKVLPPTAVGRPVEAIVPPLLVTWPGSLRRIDAFCHERSNR